MESWFTIERKRKYLAFVRAKAAYECTAEQIIRGNRIAIRFLEPDRIEYELAYKEWKQAEFAETAKKK